MCLGVLNIIFLNFSSKLSHLELRICPIQIVVITSFVVISNVDIKRVDSIWIVKGIFHVEVLTFKAPITTNRQHFRSIFFLFFRKNNPGNFMRMVCPPAEMSSIIFSEKNKKKKNKLSSALEFLWHFKG